MSYPFNTSSNSQRIAGELFLKDYIVDSCLLKENMKLVHDFLKQLCTKNDPCVRWIQVSTSDENSSISKLEIAVHSLAIGARSPVLKAAFSKRWSTPGQTLDIPETNPEAFLVMIRYLYTGQLLLRWRIIWDVVELSKRYQIPNLSTVCEELIIAHFQENEVIEYYQGAKLYDLPFLFKYSLGYIRFQGECIFKSDLLFSLDENEMKDIVSDKLIKADEITIWEGCFRWAQNKARLELRDKMKEKYRNNYKMSNEMIQTRVLELMRSLAFFIAVPEMKLESFTSGPALSGVFKKSECSAIYNHIVNRKYFSCCHHRNITSVDEFIELFPKEKRERIFNFNFDYIFTEFFYS